MKFPFTKMHGAGNDFIVAEMPRLPETGSEKLFCKENIAFLCDRHLGVGGDGLILIRPLPEKNENDLPCCEMRYFNSDGGMAEMCGNGLRCAASFAYKKGLFPGAKKVEYRSCGIREEAEILDDAGERIRISLSLTEEFQAYEIEYEGKIYKVYKGKVGVPHAVIVLPEKEEWEKLDIKTFGAFLRYHALFAPAGTNVDFLFFEKGEERKETPEIFIRTYERGVEEETLCCGTGCSSSALVLRKFFSFPEKLRLFCRKGDEIEIEIMQECNILKGVYLSGPAKTVFEASLVLEEDTFVHG